MKDWKDTGKEQISLMTTAAQVYLKSGWFSGDYRSRIALKYMLICTIFISIEDFSFCPFLCEQAAT